MYLRLPVYDEMNRDTGQILVVPIEALREGWLTSRHVTAGDKWNRDLAAHVLAGCEQCAYFRQQAHDWVDAQ